MTIDQDGMDAGRSVCLSNGDAMCGGCEVGTELNKGVLLRIVGNLVSFNLFGVNVIMFNGRSR